MTEFSTISLSKIQVMKQAFIIYCLFFYILDIYLKRQTIDK